MIISESRDCHLQVFHAYHESCNYIEPNSRAVGTSWQGVTDATPIFETFTTVCQTLTHQHLSDFTSFYKWHFVIRLQAL